MKLSKAEIRREIEKISSSYSSDEIFSSPYYSQILQAIVTSACESLNRIPVVDAGCDAESDFTACTEGTTVRINTLGPLIRERDTNWEKYVNCVGHVIHECGHVLFTDFIEMMNMLDAWTEERFSFYPEKPQVEDIDVDAIVKYLDEHPNYRKMFICEMKNIQNIMEDVYIENALFEKFDGVAALGLARSREELYRQAPREDEIYDQVLEGRVSPLIGFSQILLCKRTGYPVKEAEHLSGDQKQVKQLIDSYMDLCEEEIDALKWESDGRKRCSLLNRIMVKVKSLLPEPDDSEDLEDPQEMIREMIRELLDQLSESRDEKEGENKTEASDKDYSSKTAESQTEQSSSLSKKAGMSAVPKGNSRPVNSAQPDRQTAEQSKQQSCQNAKSSSACKHRFEQAIRQMAEKQFEEKDEAAHSSSLQSEANEIVADVKSGRGNVSGFGQITTNRIRVNTGHMAVYNDVYAEVSSTSKHLAKKLSNLLKDKEVESSDSGYLMGQRFNARDVVHNDGKYFSRISIPDGRLRVCFGILVDESGSMYGEKTKDARRATILLEDTLRSLEVPFCICGHTTTSYDDVLINCYVDFDTNDGKDRYRLSEIQAISNNIDGAAITYIGEKLLKRPEEQKVLIVISDGQPCGPSFYSNNADEDTMLAIKHYRKKGINVFGAVVDEWENVSRLYGEQYAFDCQDGKELERQLIRLVKRYIRSI